MCLEKEILERLSYSKCSCEIDYRPEIKIVNAICSKHSYSKLLVDGIGIEIYQKLISDKVKKLAVKPSDIV